MRTAPLVLALLVAAALSGCTGGNSDDENPTDAASRSGTPSGDGDTRTTPAPTPRDRGRSATIDATLNVSAANGTVPLNVTFSYNATASDPNATSDLSWTLEVWLGKDEASRSNQTDNETGFGGTGDQPTNGTPDNTGSPSPTSSSTPTSPPPSSDTGNQTDSPPPENGGNSTGNSTSGSSTGPGGNSTGNQTGNQTAGSPMWQPGFLPGPRQQPMQASGGSGNANEVDDAARARSGTLVASFNGTGDALPGEASLVLNQTGHYTAVFTVRAGQGSQGEAGPKAVRTAAVDVGPMPPGTFLGNETRTFEGSFLASEPFVCMGREDFGWAMNATLNGTAAHVDHVWAVAEADGTLSDVTLTLLDGNGTEIASGPGLDTNGTNGTGFPAGTYTLRVESCVAADTVFKVTATARYVSV